MILACHLVWTAYGWWFPNDPRGSWSKEVWVPEIRGISNEGGVLIRGRQAVQPSRSHMQKWLREAQKHLKYEPVFLNKIERKAVFDAIMEQARLHGYVILEHAVMPEHVHIVVTRHHAHKFQRMVQAFKSVSTRKLHKLLAALPARRSRRDSCKSGCATRAAGSAAKKPVWSRGYWARYLNTDEEIEIAIKYVKKQK